MDVRRAIFNFIGVFCYFEADFLPKGTSRTLQQLSQLEQGSLDELSGSQNQTKIENAVIFIESRVIKLHINDTAFTILRVIWSKHHRVNEHCHSSGFVLPDVFEEKFCASATDDRLLQQNITKGDIDLQKVFRLTRQISIV